MKKTILIVMVLVILSIGMVEGLTSLGEELASCGDFDCGADVFTEWTLNSWDVTIDIFGTLARLSVVQSTFMNQSFPIKSQKTYQITTIYRKAGAVDPDFFKIQLGNVNESITVYDGTNLNEKTFQITTLDNSQLRIHGGAFGPGKDLRMYNISVKEIITVTEVKWTPRRIFDLNKIFKYIRRIFTKEQPRNVEIIFRHG